MFAAPTRPVLLVSRVRRHGTGRSSPATCGPEEARRSSADCETSLFAFGLVRKKAHPWRTATAFVAAI